jgi:hypothetical protein
MISRRKSIRRDLTSSSVNVGRPITERLDIDLLLVKTGCLEKRKKHNSFELIREGAS